MSIEGNVESGDSATPPDATGVFVLVGPATSGTDAPGYYQYSQGQDPYADIGPGLLCEQALHHLSNGNDCIVCPAPITTVGTLSNITHTGTGSALMTWALTEDQTTPADAFTFKSKVKVAGPNGTAILQYNLDGGTAYPYETAIPAETHPSLTSLVDITNGADLAGLTLIFTAPAAKTLTFLTGSLAAAPAALKAATASVAAPVVLTAADLIAGGKTTLLARPRRLTFTTAGGTAADAPASVDIVGTRLGVVTSETLVLAQAAAMVTSVQSYDVITSLTYPAADGVGATIAIGYSSAFADAAEVVTAFNALAVAAPLAVTGSALQDSSGHTFLHIEATGSGPSVSVTIDATSTADTPAFGFTGAGLTATGAAAKLAIPYTNITATFAQGDYIKDDKFEGTSTAPRATIAALLAAATLPRTNNLAFTKIVIAQPMDTAGNTEVLADALDVLVEGWGDDEGDPIDVCWTIQAPLHTASATAATNRTNITANDNAVKLTLADETSEHGEICVGDVYVTGQKLLGRYRRGTAFPKAARAAKIRLSADPGAGDTEANLPGCSLVHPDGVTYARNENTAAIRMGTMRGAGFTTLRLRGPTGVRVAGSFSRAVNTSRLYRFPVMRAAYLGATTLRELLVVYELQDWQLDPTGKMQAGDRKSLDSTLTRAMRAALVDAPNNHFSSVTVVVDAAEKMSNTSRITAIGTAQIKGFSEDIKFTIKVVGTVAETTVAA